MSKIRVGDIRVYLVDEDLEAVYLILPDKKYFALKESEEIIGKVLDGVEIDDSTWEDCICIGNLIEDRVNWEQLYEAYITSR